VSDTQDRALAEAILAQVDVARLPSRERIETFLRVGEWAQAGIQVLYDAANGNAAVEDGLFRKALDMWLEDMGGYLEDKFRAALAPVSV
jgi:hypothetical protein